MIRATPRPASPLALLGVSPDDLAGVSEIAEMLGVARPTAAKYVERGDFPEPYANLSRGRVWLRDDVKAWAKRTLPLRTGRPPRKAE